MAVGEAGLSASEPVTLFRARGRRLAWIGLVAVLLAAGWLRTLGLTFGLPAVYNPDEVAIMSRALAFAKGDLNPHNFLYPTLYFYVLFGWVGAYFAGGWVTGVFSSAAAFQQQFFVDPSGVYLAGRVLSVLFGVAGVWVTYRLASRVYGRAAGIAAAAILAVAPFHVRDSHYVKHDVFAALAIGAAVWAIVRFADASANDPARLRKLMWASALCGVAFSIHYYAVFLAAPLILAIAVSGRTTARVYVYHLAVSAVTAGVLFFACSPFLLVEPQTALSDIVANRRIVVDRALETPAGMFPYVATYAGMLWNDAIGRGAVVLAVVGLAAGTVTSWRRTVLLLAFPVAFFAFVTNTVPATRYLTPVLPFVSVFAGIGAAVPLRFLKRTGGVVCAGLIVASAVPAGVQSARDGRFFAQADTRTQALRFVERRIPPGASIAVQPYSVPLTQSRDSLIESFSANRPDARPVPTKVALRLALDPYPAPAYRLIYLGDGGLDEDKIYVGYRAFAGSQGLEPLRRIGVGYVLLKRPLRRDAHTGPLVDALEREADRLATFSPFIDAGSCAPACPEPFVHNADARIDPRLERPGPVIEVWQLRGHTGG